MSLFGGNSNDSVEGAKGSARDTADQAKKSAQDGKNEVKGWGRSVRDEAKGSWEDAKNWGRDSGKEFESNVSGGGSSDQLLDLGHPLINRVFDGFVKIGGIGAVQASLQDSVRLFVNDDTSKKSFENSAQKVGVEALKWGVAAGVYSGLTYGIEEVRGKRDWKNHLVGGALTGAALSLTEQNPAPERILASAITGGAIASAAEVFRKIL